MDKQAKRNLNKKKLTILVVGLVLLFIFIYYICTPKISLNGDRKVELHLNENYEELGAKAKNFNKDISDQIETIGKVDVKNVGTYEIKYMIKKYGLEFSKIRKVVISDNMAPVITLKGESKVKVCPNSEYDEAGYTAIDNYDGDITDNVTIKKEKDKIKYIVKDNSGNKTEIIREITYEDSTPPIINLKGAKNLYIKVNDSYKEPGFTVKDNCDDDLDKDVVINSNVDTKKVGDYKIEYTVLDKNQNKTTIIRNVFVRDSIPSSSQNAGIIYLTFDDGPSRSITPKILDVLKKKDVKATFFVINHSSSLDYLIKRAHDEGHTIGLHSYTHNYKTVYKSMDSYFNDLQMISNKVKKITNEESKIIRFPGGTSNTISRKYSKNIMTNLSQEVIKRGYKYYDWNIGSGDSGGVKTKEGVYNNVVKSLSHKQVNMILMHDFENNYKTLEALSAIIDYGLKNGYEFKAIDTTTPIVAHRPNN